MPAETKLANGLTYKKFSPQMKTVAFTG